MSVHSLAIIGAHGKMGRAVATLAPERGFRIVASIDAPESHGASSITRDSLAGAQVAIDFTVPDAALPNVRAAVDAGCPIVVGTTGWYDRLPEASAYVADKGGAMLWAPNFSIGVNLFDQIVKHAARLFAAAPGFDAHIVETHHSAKKDAPSGTALKLAASAEGSLGRKIPVTSIRTGSVPGTHELIFDAPFEQVRLEHLARDRRVFAEGALLAATWLIGRRGVFTMSDVLTSTPSDA
jgi:4-hydroxy-tetrahydrodipicolinate reductase